MNIIEKLIIWYLKTNNCLIQKDGYIVRLFSSCYYDKIKEYEQKMWNTRC